MASFPYIDNGLGEAKLKLDLEEGVVCNVVQEILQNFVNKSSIEAL